MHLGIMRHGKNMMIKKRGFAIFVLLIFLVGFISAVDTRVKIKTLPLHEVQATAFDPKSSNFHSYEQFIGISNQFGDVYFNYSVDEEFNIIVFIKTLEHEKVMSKKFTKEFEPGEDISLEVAPDSFELIPTPEINESEIGDEELEVDANVTTNETEVDNEDESSGISGFAISDLVPSNKIMYYVGGGVLGLIILVLVIWLFKRKRNKSPKEIKVTKLSDLKAQQAQASAKDEELKGAEEELKQAQAKIDAIKNKDKIADLQAEIDQKQKELKELNGNISNSKNEIAKQKASQQTAPAKEAETVHQVSEDSVKA